MIAVTVFMNNSDYCGFVCKGHAGYSVSGKDIVCAAVSALVINTANSIETLTKSKVSMKVEEDDGFIQFDFVSSEKEKTNLLMESFILGLKGIQKDYKNRYLNIEFKEV